MKLFQTWKSTDIESLHPTYKYCYGTWQKIHPEWEYKFLDDTQIAEYCKLYFPEYYEEFIGLPKGILRSDLVRYMILYIEGGLYVDMDFMALKHHVDIVELAKRENKNIVFGKLSRKDIYGDIPNAWMMSLKKHEVFWLFVLREGFARCKCPEYTIEAKTGPRLISDCLDEYNAKINDILYDKTFQSKSDVLLLPVEYIYPCDWLNEQTLEYKKLADDNVEHDKVIQMFPNSYAITFWTHNWVDSLNASG